MHVRVRESCSPYARERDREREKREKRRGRGGGGKREMGHGSFQAGISK